VKIFFPRLSVIEHELKIQDPLPLRRCYYIFDSATLLQFEWRSGIPKEFTFHRIDSKLLQSLTATTFLEDLKKRIKSTWKSLDDFLNRGIGFCAVKNDTEIVNWAISEWITNNKTEIGVETDEPYRRQGFASRVCAAFIEYCQKQNIPVGWHCSEHNEGSWKTAEKIGLTKNRNYVAVLRYYNEDQNLWENAWYYGLYLENPQKGLKYINTFLKRVTPEARHLAIRAQLLIPMGEYEKALDDLLQTVDLGLENPSRFRTNLMEAPIFEPLRSLDRFPQLLLKIKNTYPQ